MSKRHQLSLLAELMNKINRRYYTSCHKRNVKFKYRTTEQMRLNKLQRFLYEPER